jgi:hypothetical protein
MWSPDVVLKSAAHEQNTKARIARVNILTKAMRAKQGGRMRVD